MDGEKTEFIWQGNRLIAESRQNDKVWQSYIYEPDSFRPLALVEGHAKKSTKTRTFWYQNDQLGSPIKLTDSLGDTIYECEYNAYGQLSEERWPLADNHIKPINPLRLPGQYFDEESGLHYNLNRYYDPGMGRYITQDPLGIAGGLNPYQYCQNPVNWIDPLGLFNVSRNGFEGVVGKGTDIVDSSFKELSIDEISKINKFHGGSTTLTGEIDTILANMSYRDGFYDKAAVAIRDIAGRHLFNDGNKRTAQTVVEQLAKRNGVNLPPAQIRKVVDDVAIGKLREIEDISRALKNGK